MAELLEAIASFIVIFVVVKIGLAAMLGGLYEWRSWRFVADRVRRPPPAPPTHRPLGRIAADARRIAAGYHQEGMRFAQYEGRRQAFDRILAEAAAVVGVDHLLDVLPPGVELDRERARIETALVEAGVLVLPPERAEPA
jgi:hypothetical protein